VLPEPAEFYQLAKSHDFATWPEEKLDDVSLHIFGFPTANARPIEATKHGTLYFLGVASMLVHYSASLNETGFKALDHSVSKERTTAKGGSRCIRDGHGLLLTGARLR